MKVFMATDGVEMTFEMVEEICGCQRFKVTTKGGGSRTVTLVGLDTEKHYKTLCALLAHGMCDFEDLAEAQFC